MKQYLVASFFAGVGGIDLGVAQTGKFRTVFANEFDPYPAETFETNFDLKVDRRDIRLVQPGDIPEADGYLFGHFSQKNGSSTGQRGWLHWR